MHKHVAQHMAAWVLTLTLLAGCSGTEKTPPASPVAAPASALTCQLAHERDRQAVDWLRQSALPLTGVKAGAPSGDLQPLKTILKDVQVVGLGEATHGTAEFFHMKHRLLEFLVREMGYTLFAIEASYSAGLAVNDYVLHGKGEPEQVLAGLRFWTVDTAEVAEMIRWMRSYNESVPPERQVRFVGFDIQIVEPAADWLGEYLGRTAPDLWAPRAGLMPDLAPRSKITLLRNAPNGTQVQADLQALVADLEANRERLAAASSAAEAQVAINLARNLQRYHEVYGVVPQAEGNATRDRYMAATFAELREQYNPSAKAVLWGHNVHMSTHEGWMGAHLRQALGDRYYALGFAFGKGAFQAQGERAPLREWTVGPAPEGYVEWYLGCATTEQLGLFNFRQGARPTVADAWLEQPHPFRQLGSVWKPEWDNAAYYEQWGTRLHQFDGLIYVPVTTRANRPRSQ